MKQTTPVYYVIENSVNYFFCSINICICIYIGSNILKFWKRGFWLFLTSKTDLLTPYFYSKLAVVWDAVVFSKYGQVVEKSDWKQLRSTSWILIRNLLELLFSSCYVSCPHSYGCHSNSKESKCRQYAVHCIRYLSIDFK